MVDLKRNDPTPEIIEKEQTAYVPATTYDLISGFVEHHSYEYYELVIGSIMYCLYRMQTTTSHSLQIDRRSSTISNAKETS